MPKKQVIIIVSSIIAILIIGIIVFFVIQSQGEKPEEALNRYISLINEKKYEDMYQMISDTSKEKVTKENFIERNQAIYEGIDMANMNLTIKTINKKENNVQEIEYEISMDTNAGKVTYTNQTELTRNKEKKYGIEWDDSMIYPGLTSEQKIKVKTLSAERGSIYDRNNTLLAGKGSISSIGLVPGKMSENAEDDLEKLSTILGISVDSIQKKLSASYVKEDTFVALKNVAKENSSIKEQALTIPGVKITTTSSRVYPLGEEAAQLIGYVQNISAEELEELSGKGYNSNSIIGKSGLEKIYEDKLRGTDGCEIYIVDEEGERVKTIAKQDLKNGEDIKLTIDANMQKQIYNSLEGNKGAFVAMNPKTGEVLALVSTPSYNSNDFVLGMTNEEWKAISEDENKPMLNRYTQTWSPGSTFKPVTGAIGITSGTLDPNEDFGTSGLSWQKDSSWGDYKVTTLTPYTETANLRNALIRSDNIYFAKAALKIGETNFIEGLKKIGFGEEIPFEQGLSKSSYSNEEGMEEIQLADSGYGQGEILANPVHMASIYSAFVNEGNMIKPYLIYQEDKQVEYYKEQAFSKEAAETIKEDLVQVVESPNGTAHDAKISGVTIGAKTGTAELKRSKEEEGEVIGWFNAFTADENEENPLVVVSMIEDANKVGGSHYLFPKVTALFQ